MFPLRDILADEVGPDVGRREHNKLRTRALLNAAAVRLFAERGYDDTSVEAIAAEAGVSVRTLFRYFASKEDVLFAREMDISEFLTNLAEQPPDVPPLTAIRRAYTQQRALTEEEVELMLSFRDAMAATAALQGRYVENLGPFRVEVAAVLARRAGRRAPTEADVLAATLGQAVLDHVFTRWLTAGATRDLRKAVDQAFGLVGGVAGASAGSAS